MTTNTEQRSNIHIDTQAFRGDEGQKLLKEILAILHGNNQVEESESETKEAHAA